MEKFKIATLYSRLIKDTAEQKVHDQERPSPGKIKEQPQALRPPVPPEHQQPPHT
jgi:hypothetical protein